MAYVYEINGQRVEFEKEPTDADIDEAAKQLGPAPTAQAPSTSGFGTEAKSVGLALAVPAAQAIQYAVENPITTATGLYGAYKGSQLANAGIDALRRIGTAPTPTPTAPVAPPAAPPVTPPPATSPILGPNGQPLARPVAPAPVAPAAPQPAQPGVIDKATQMVRQLAASKVMQGMARVGGTAAAALTPGNVGQNYPFPQSGPLRGSEINPATGRPWTKPELDAYRAQYGG